MFVTISKSIFSSKNEGQTEIEIIIAEFVRPTLPFNACEVFNVAMTKKYN